MLWVIQDITERRQPELELGNAIEAVMSDASWFSRNAVEKLANLRARLSGAHVKEMDGADDPREGGAVARLPGR